MSVEQTELNPVHVPRFLMLIISIGYAVWFFIIPLIFVLRMQRPDYLFAPACGLLLIPVAIMSLFVRRLVFYFYYRFFWYITALSALGALTCGGTIAVTMLLNPSTFSQLPIPNNPSALIPLSMDVSALNNFAYVVFGLGAFGLVVFLARGRRRARTAPAAVDTLQQSRINAEKDLRRQLAERPDRLGR